jgi:hypothetical protein
MVWLGLYFSNVAQRHLSAPVKGARYVKIAYLS